MPFQDARGGWPARQPGPQKRRLGSRQVEKLDTEALLSELSREAVSAVARVLSVGGAIQFGSTRSRGALLVRAWIEGDQYEDYCTSVAELVATFEALDDVVEATKARSTRPVP